MTDSSKAKKKNKITYTASTQGIERALNALKRSGLGSKSNFAKSRFLAPNTVHNFFQRRPIQLDSFERICQELELNWREIAELSEEKQFERLERSDYSSLDTNEEVEQVQTLHPQVTAIDEPSQTKLPRKDWGDAPDVPVFFGRTKELADLEQWILQDHCRLVAIVGIGGIGKTGLSIKLGKGGIGKTDLSLKLAKGIEDEFEYVIFRRLLNPQTITNILSDFIRFLSNQQEIDFSDTVDSQISRLLHYLRQHRCLLILDNVEAILQKDGEAGQYQEEYKDYGELFKIIGEVSHKSCLLLTSREKPNNISILANPNKPVRYLELGGLAYLEGRKVFEDSGNFYGSDKEWEELIEFYNGNPLALKLTANHIIEVFGGDISKFRIEGKKIFSDISKLLDWHFERLSYQEKEILYWLAINREPVSLKELREDILSWDAKNDLPSTLQSLQRRLPLEKSLDSYTLQPVLIEYMTERLIKKSCEEIRSEEIELFNSHSLIKALAKDYVRESQQNLILKPVKDRVIESLGSESNLEVHLKNIISNIRKKSVTKLEYTSGNIVNLLYLLKTKNLGDYDFSHITILQAYLTEAILHNANFSYSNISKSVFNETFGAIESVSFSSELQKFAMSGDANGDIYLWDILNYQKLFTCSGHTKWVRSITFSSDGQTLASGSDDYNVKLWNAANGECLHTLEGHTNRVLSVTFSSDGQILASCSSDGTVKLWNTSTGQNTKTLEVSNEWVRSVAFSCNLFPESQILATGSGDGIIKLWNITTGECIKSLMGHTSYIWSVAFSPISQVLVSGGEDKTIRLWDIKTGECWKILKGHTGRVHSVSFSRDGQKIASCSEDKTIKLWNGQTGDFITTLNEHTGRVKSVNFSFDCKILASGDENKTVKLWSVDQGKCIKTLQGYSNSIRSIVFSKDGKFLIFGGDDQNIQAWDFEENYYKKLLTSPNNLVWSIAFSSNGKTLASTNGYQSVRVSASNFVALDTDKKLKILSRYQFFIQNRTNCRK